MRASHLLQGGHVKLPKLEPTYMLAFAIAVVLGAILFTLFQGLFRI